MAAALVLFSGSCSKLTRVLKNPNVDEKYQAALDYYNDGDYYRAGLVFEDLIPNMVGRAESEMIQYYYAYCQYHQQMYELASNYFKTFHDTYRRSQYAQEALYMSAYSIYLSTPTHNLDQSNTEKAIEAMQDFLNRYPQTNYTADANEAIRVMRRKLEFKAYDIAKQYGKLGYFKAAIIAYNNFQRDFPDSDMREEIMFLRLESQYEMSKVSIQNLKKERFEEAIQFYYDLIDRYPQGKYAKPAENIFNSCQRQLQGLGVETASEN